MCCEGRPNTTKHDGDPVLQRRSKGDKCRDIQGLTTLVPQYEDDNYMGGQVSGEGRIVYALSCIIPKEHVVAFKLSKQVVSREGAKEFPIRGIVGQQRGKVSSRRQDNSSKRGDQLYGTGGGHETAGWQF